MIDVSDDLRSGFLTHAVQLENLVRETETRRRHGLLVVAVKRGDGQMVFNPDADFVFRPADTIIVMGKPGDTISWETKHRMIVNSCLEDGEFTRLLYENRFSCCFTKVQACLAAAEATGDIVECMVSRENRVRFAHHLAAMIAINHLPRRPVIDYHVDREELLHEVIWFALRGLGLTDNAIARHYNPKALSVFFGVSSQ